MLLLNNPIVLRRHTTAFFFFLSQKRDNQETSVAPVPTRPACVLPSPDPEAWHQFASCVSATRVLRVRAFGPLRYGVGYVGGQWFDALVQTVVERTIAPRSLR